MRKSIVVSLAVVMALLATAVGIILAQDNTGTAWLGVRLAEDSETGVTIEKVTTGSPAETGGLLVGDVIVSVDGEAVETAQGLTDVIQSHTPGDAVSIVILRDGSESTLEIELGSAQERGHGNFDSSDPVNMASRMLHVQLSATDEGYQVVAGRMRDESLLAVDDIITAVNGTTIADVDWQALQDELANQDSPVITLTVLRDGEETTVELEQIGGLHGSTDGRGPGGGHGGHGGLNSQDGTVPDSGQDSTGAMTAPHEVPDGMTCTDCHNNDQNSSPTTTDTTDL